MADLPPLPEGFTLDGQQAGLPPLPAGFTLDTPKSASIPDEAQKGFMGTVYGVGQGIADLIHKIRPPETNEDLSPEDRTKVAEFSKQAAKQYKDYMAQNAPAVPSVGDITSGHDFALWSANKLGGMTPYALSALLGGVPAMSTFAAAQGGEQEAQQPGSTPASIATGAGLGGLSGMLPVPFLRSGGSSIAGRIAGTATGGSLFGAATGATANIPRAVATGDPEQGLPTSEGLWDSILGGAVGMGAFGAAHASVDKAVAKLRAPSATPDNQANVRLSERINDAVDQNGYDLSKVNYDAGNGSKAALDKVHLGLASDINYLWNTIKGTLPDPTDVAGGLDRAHLDGIMKAAVNKVKGRVGPDDLTTLERAVGHTQEGHVLLDLVRQSNTLTDLFNGGMKGGVSKYTDFLNPLGRGGPENGFGSVLARAGGKAAPLVETALLLSHPALLPAAGVQGAAVLGGRAIDAVTGRRSTVAKFVRDNSGDPEPLDFGNRPSIIRQQSDAVAQLAALRLQHEQARNLQQAQDQFGQQQDQANQARLLQREQELRTQNRLDNNPGLGGYDRYVYDQTGLKPNDAVPGVFELFRTGKITPQEFHAFFNSPRDLMGGNAGNHIVDMLDKMARDGQLQRDTEWQPAQRQAADASANPPQMGNNPAYAAQAAGNQARVTAAMDRVAGSEHSSSAKQAINDAIATIGRTNNRQHASEVRDNLVQSLAPHSPDAARFAHQELDPLVKQIRHATPDAAEGRSIPRGADLRPLTEDATRDGNTLTRTLAAAYKLKSGINKPHYDGKRDPDQGYLKTVAEFHDKATHAPDDPAVKASYDALARETIAQFKSLGGIKVETWKGEGEPYRNSKEMMRDVADKGHLWFLPTDSAFGANGEEIAHPMLAPTGLKTSDGHPLLVNDVFRIVHDFYGHTQHGFQFGPVGEYNAYREHAQMYSDAALPALAAETLAQNAWVNFGPHNPQSLPPSERPFSAQKAYAVPPEILARDPNIGREFIDAIGNDPRVAEIKQAPEPVSNKLHDLIPGFKGIAKYLTPDEQSRMVTRTAKLLVEKFTNLPKAEEMASVAYSGRAKRGWYAQSAKAITSIFGQADAPRFAALLAALSPQTSVESNLTNALNVWRGWIEADRPSDQRSIMRILGENVEGDKGPGSVLDAWVNNSVRALTAPDGEPVTISGPKVTSFMQNLLGEVNEVTNDTWMANYAGIKQEAFKGAKRAGDNGDEIGNLYGKGPGYLAMNALVRKAADVLTKRTGETWTPAEVQETVWSWAKALSEKSNSKQSATQLVKQEGLSHDEIASVPDFEKLFVSDTYARILDQAGYGDYVDNLKSTVEERGGTDPAGNGPGGTPFSAEGAGVSQAALLKHLVGAAKRLDTLKSGNAPAASGPAPVTGRVANAADFPAVNLQPGEFVLAHHPTVEQANQVAGRITGRPVRVVKHDAGAAVVAGPKPDIEYPTATVPPERAYTDPEGRRGAASFVAGIENPDGTTKGLSTPEIRAVAKSIARLVEGGIPAPGQNGSYSEHNNTLRVYGGMSPEQHARVLGHETGHAIEALANVVGIIDRGNPSGDRSASPAAKTLDLVKDLQAVSRLERPHLWADDAELERSMGHKPAVIHEYRNRLDELFADNIRHYMVDPVGMKKVAPVAARFIRDMVNPSKIGKVIAFAGLGGLALPGLIAQALSGLYNQDQEQGA